MPVNAAMYINDSCYPPSTLSPGSPSTIFIVSKLTVMTFPTSPKQSD